MPPIQLYIDTDVIVSYEMGDESNSKESTEFMKFILGGERNPPIDCYTSRFSILEAVSAKKRRTHNTDQAYSLAYRMIATWKEKIVILDPPFKSFNDYIEKLIEISIEFETPAGDTVHAYCVKEYKMDYLITWNKDHYKVLEEKIDQLSVLTPTEFMTEYQKNNVIRQQ